MTKRLEDRLSEIISVRVPSEAKLTLRKEAAAENKRLGDYIFDLIILGREALWAKKKTEKEAARAAGGDSGGRPTKEPGPH